MRKKNRIQKYIYLLEFELIFISSKCFKLKKAMKNKITTIMHEESMQTSSSIPKVVFMSISSTGTQLKKA